MSSNRPTVTELDEPYETVPQPIWCCDDTGRCLYTNSSMTATTGQALEALLEWGYLDAVHPDDRDRLRDLLPAHWLHTEPIEYEFRLRQANGIHHWVCGRSQAVRSASGALRYWVSTCHDIDALKRAERTLARRGDLATRLLHLTQALAQATDLQAALTLTLRGCHEVLQAHGVLLYLWSDDARTLLLAGAHGYSEEEQVAFQSVPIDAPLPATQAARTDAPVWIEDRVEDHHPQMQWLVAAHQVQALACLPLTRAGQRLGVLVLDFTVPQDFDPDRRALLTAAGDEIAQALTRTGLLTARSWLERHHALLHAFADLLSPTLTRADVYRVVLHESAEVTGAYGGFFTEMDPDGETLRLTAQWGYAPRFGEVRQVMASTAALPVQVVRRTGSAVFLSTREALLRAYPDVADTLEGRTQALAVLPLLVDGEVVGTLTLSYAHPHPFDALERKFLAALVTHTAKALRRARVYELEQAARRQAEEIARHEQVNLQSLRGTLNALPNLVWFLTPEGRVQEFNDQWRAYTGLADAQGSSAWLAALHPDDRDAALQLRTSSIQAGRRYSLELRLRRADGVYRWHVARVEPVRVEGQVVRWIGSATDIDDQKRTEERLEQRVEERTRRWQDLNVELRAVATTLAGSLEEPLRRTNGVVSLIEQRLQDLKDGQDDRLSQLIRLLTAETQRMSGVADEIRQFTQLENRELRFVRVPLYPLIVQVRSDLEPHTRPRPVRWVMGVLPAVRGDALRLRQVFTEVFLLLLSRPASGEDTVLTTRAVVRGAQVEVVVHSNGHFSEEDLAVLRAPFDLNRSGPLGLANVRRIMQRHGGDVAAHGVEEGTAFTLTLPLWQNEAPTGPA